MSSLSAQGKLKLFTLLSGILERSLEIFQWEWEFSADARVLLRQLFPGDEADTKPDEPQKLADTDGDVFMDGLCQLVMLGADVRKWEQQAWLRTTKVAAELTKATKTTILFKSFEEKLCTQLKTPATSTTSGKRVTISLEKLELVVDKLGTDNQSMESETGEVVNLKTRHRFRQRLTKRRRRNKVYAPWQPRLRSDNPYVDAGLEELEHENDSDTYEDLEGFIVCKGDRNYYA
mmetsp:Transcript_14541/g.23675  ORF Transcript_14541/g.23675 Transcript_14541/m.23675 type:complete len:233 (+) Transcript_14541:543-1241(+)